MPKLQVGRVVLNESEIRPLSEKPGDGFPRSLSVEGIEYTGSDSIGDIRTKQADIVNSYGLMVPVLFATKTDWSGYYVVTSSDATLNEWTTQGASALEWKFELDLLGMANDIDVESRLGGALTLANDFATAGERWHAPSGGHRAYWSGNSQPSQVVRTGSEGAIKVYRDVDPTVNPRWNCPVNLYSVGRARFTDADGNERTGQAASLNPVGWSIHNSLIKLTSIAGKLEVATHDGINWEGRNWDVRHNDIGLGSPAAISIMRNDYELVQVRLLWNVAPSGRVTADLTLRRGARHVEVFVKSMLSSKIGLHPYTGTASTNGTGQVTATADDAQGNRYTVGSSKTYVADTANGGLSKATTLTLDAYIGSVVGGGSATAGNTAVDLFEQFLGAPSERVIGVRI